MMRQMKYVNNVNRILWNSNISRRLSSSNVEQQKVVEVKDMSIHGLCINSIKEAAKNFTQYIMKSPTAKLALGRWHVEQVSKVWEKKSRYY